MVNVLVISDTHINPDDSTSEELWRQLGRYCVETKPDYIVHLGDTGDYNSQAWLKSARGPYTLEQELDSVKRCIIAFQREIVNFNVSQRRSKHKQYKPKRVLTLGNHDTRNDIAAVQELFEHYGWSVYNYLEPFQLDGVSFVHAMHKGLSEIMCTTAQELIENWHGNIVVGHGHHKDFHESFSLATNETITALRSPVFTLEEPKWCVQTSKKWSRGFTELTTKPFTFVWRELDELKTVD